MRERTGQIVGSWLIVRLFISSPHTPDMCPALFGVRPAGRTYSEVKVLYTLGKGKC